MSFYSGRKDDRDEEKKEEEKRKKLLKKALTGPELSQHNPHGQIERDLELIKGYGSSKMKDNYELTVKTYPDGDYFISAIRETNTWVRTISKRLTNGYFRELREKKTNDTQYDKAFSIKEFENRYAENDE